ncbi:hypothetical protein OSG_eHP23_00025 [environmental Halophage eHP-23]|nr:hypothetical protein OSG_eHP23_00025 [environmental Halophage eHP-23]
MAVEEPFQVFDKRESVLSNISAMSDEDKKDNVFIWLAELNGGTSVCQFDGRGEEQNFGKVRTGLEKGNVKALYWVPVKAGMDSYGVKTADVDGDAGLMKRGFIQVESSGVEKRRGWAYRIKAGDFFLFVDASGDTVSTHDGNLNVVDKLVDR